MLLEKIEFLRSCAINFGKFNFLFFLILTGFEILKEKKLISVFFPKNFKNYFLSQILNFF
jgi:hypothetical protein